MRSDRARGLPDRLEYGIYAEAIGRVVKSIESPEDLVCVGLFAPWGSGKTFFWELIKDYMENSSKKERKKIANKYANEQMNEKATIVARSSVLAFSCCCQVMLFFCGCSGCYNINEEDVAMIMILSCPIWILVWVICFLICGITLCIKRCLYFIPSCIHVNFSKKYDKWYKSDKCVYPVRNNEVTLLETSPLLGDVEYQQQQQPQGKTIKCSDVWNILTGKTDHYEGKEETSCISISGIKLILVTLFQNSFQFLFGLYSSFYNLFRIMDTKLMKIK